MRLPRKDLGLEKDEPTQALQMGVPAAESTLRLNRDEMSFEEPTVALKAGVPAAESTLRLNRDEMSFEEPTVALQAGVPAAESTLRLKRDEMPFDEPTVALQAGVPAAEATLRMKRDELVLEEPTQPLTRPKLRTAMEVIDEATQAEIPQAKPSVMMPDATDIPSWEETTQFFTPPQSGHADATVRMTRPSEPMAAPVDPSASMDETFPNVSTPVLQEPRIQAPSLMLVSEISETEEDTLVLPDMQELDDLPNAMKATMVMPVMEAPAAPETPEPMEATTIMQVEPKPAPSAPFAPSAPMEKTMVMSVMEAPVASETPEPMEATTIMHLEPKPAPSVPSAPREKTMVMPVMESPVAPETPEPMEATIIMRVEPKPAPTAQSTPMEKTMVMPVMEAPTAPETPEPMEATAIMHLEPKPAPSAPSELMEKTMVMPLMEAPAAPETPEPMGATTIMPISAEEPSAYLTRQGQSPWPPSTDSPEPSPVSTQLMSESLLSKAMEATSGNADSALAPVPPEVSSIEEDSPLAKAATIPATPTNPIRPSSPGQDRTVDTSIGMAVTPSTLLMPIQPSLDPTVPIQRPMSVSASNADSARSHAPVSGASQPMQSRPEPKPAEPLAVVASPSVPGYPDRQVPVPAPESKFQTKPIENPNKPENVERPVRPVKQVSPAYVPMPAQSTPQESSSKLWIPVAIAVLLLVIGGIYFAFFKTSQKTSSPLVILPSQAKEPGLPVPASMQGTLAQAKAGDSKAMHMLGVSFYYGLNVPQNKAEGLRWMQKAVDAGNEKARSDLRQMEAGSR
ncbi:MAG: hypothetical protein IPP78_12150 [Holophagaceae bacterium]|nr:hypothetical protein [Holophagaceae bacterium]